MLTSPWTIPLIIAVGVGGPRLWMNVRPADPLPQGFRQYSAREYAAARDGGTVILVDVYASWCPTCKVQHRALDTLLRAPQYKEVTAFRVDFDRDGEWRRDHGVGAQSTLLIIRGGRELSRSVGVTRPGAIRAQLDEALRAVTSQP